MLAIVSAEHFLIIDVWDKIPVTPYALEQDNVPWGYE